MSVVDTDWIFKYIFWIIVNCNQTIDNKTKTVRLDEERRLKYFVENCTQYTNSLVIAHRFIAFRWFHDMTTKTSDQSPTVSNFLFCFSFCIHQMAFGCCVFVWLWLLLWRWIKTKINASKWRRKKIRLCFLQTETVFRFAMQPPQLFNRNLFIRWFASLLVVCWPQNYVACYLTADSRIACFRLKSFFFHGFFCVRRFFPSHKLPSKQKPENEN